MGHAADRRNDPTAFVVSADAAVRDSVRALVESADLQAETFPSLQAFLDVEPGRTGCLVFDANVSDLSDPERQTTLAAVCSRMPGIFLTDRGDVPMAVRALKLGAVDVVQKPYRDENLLGGIQRALESSLADHNEPVLPTT